MSEESDKRIAVPRGCSTTTVCLTAMCPLTYQVWLEEGLAQAVQVARACACYHEVLREHLHTPDASQDPQSRHFLLMLYCTYPDHDSPPVQSMRSQGAPMSTYRCADQVHAGDERGVVILQPRHDWLHEPRAEPARADRNTEGVSSTAGCFLDDYQYGVSGCCPDSGALRWRMHDCQAPHLFS